MAVLIEIISPAPVINIPDFSFAFGGKSGCEIPLNTKGHPYCFEFVALKGMVFQVKETLPMQGFSIFRIAYPLYFKETLYIDSRFTKTASIQPSFRPLPRPETILQRMIAMSGTPYVWGGNWSEGIPEMLSYYPTRTRIDDPTSIYWTLKGVDCSGLLFEATEGATPRNTAQLIRYGTPVPVGSPLKPLDMILYPGHVVFVADEKTSIESKFPFGVIQRNLHTRLWEFDFLRKRVENWTSDLDPLMHYTVRRIT